MRDWNLDLTLPRKVADTGKPVIVSTGMVTLDLCRWFVDQHPASLAQARVQEGEETFYPRRRREDSRLDPDKTLAEQFNLLRVVDEERYPAYFDHLGRSYHMTISAKQDLASSPQSEPCPDSRA